MPGRIAAGIVSAVQTIEKHPFGVFYRHKFRITLNTDDRLMSETTMTKEFGVARDVFGLGLDDLEKITINSMKSGFIPYDRQIALIYDVISQVMRASEEGTRAPGDGPR